MRLPTTGPARAQDKETSDDARCAYLPIQSVMCQESRRRPGSGPSGPESGEHPNSRPKKKTMTYEKPPSPPELPKSRMAPKPKPLKKMSQVSTDNLPTDAELTRQKNDNDETTRMRGTSVEGVCICFLLATHMQLHPRSRRSRPQYTLTESNGTPQEAERCLRTHSIELLKRRLISIGNDSRRNASGTVGAPWPPHSWTRTLRRCTVADDCCRHEPTTKPLCTSQSAISLMSRTPHLVPYWIVGLNSDDKSWP